MQRPVMNPMFLEGLAATHKRRSIVSMIVMPFRFSIRMLLADVAFWRHEKLKMEDTSAIMRVLHGLLYRLLLFPICLVVLLAALVYIATHPPRVVFSADPAAVGAYYDPVNITSADGTLLEAWLVPELDAKIVLEHQEKALKMKHPAVILVHDYGCSRGQMLPLVKPLHEAGYLVLLINTRGVSGAAATFGIRESADVQAAIEMLRRRPGVDARRIALLGVGTGANAVMLAAEHDKSVAAIILDHPVTSVEQVLVDYLGPRQESLKSLRNLCKWTFELVCRVDAEELQIERHDKALSAQPLLMFTGEPSFNTLRARGQSQVCDFLAKAMPGFTATAGTDQK